MELYRFYYHSVHLRLRLAYRDAAGQVWHMGTVAVYAFFNNNEVLHRFFSVGLYDRPTSILNADRVSTSQLYIVTFDANLEAELSD